MAASTQLNGARSRLPNGAQLSLQGTRGGKVPSRRENINFAFGNVHNKNTKLYLLLAKLEVSNNAGRS